VKEEEKKRGYKKKTQNAKITRQNFQKGKEMPKTEDKKHENPPPSF
jgi:hypothetical protein